MNRIERIVYGAGSYLCWWAERNEGDRVAMLYYRGRIRYGLGVKLTSDKADCDKAVEALYRALRDVLYDMKAIDKRRVA